MLPFIFSADEIKKHVAAGIKARRLALNFSQETLAERSGVSWGTLKKFERTGSISLEALLKLMLTLGCLKDAQHLFNPWTSSFGTSQEASSWTNSISPLTSIDDLFKDKKRKRGRQ